MPLPGSHSAGQLRGISGIIIRMRTRNTSRSGRLLATAAALAFLQACATGGTETRSTAQIECLGANQCAGMSECATAAHVCAGHNDCKGQGWAYKDREQCLAAGGKVLR